MQHGYRKAGEALLRRGDFHGALASFNKELAEKQSCLELASLLNQMGTAYFKGGDPAQAIRLHRWALTTLKAQSGRLDKATNLETAFSYGCIGACMYHTNDIRGAVEQVTEALKIFNVEAPGSAVTAASFCNLGLLLSEFGDLPRSIENYGVAIQMYNLLNERTVVKMLEERIGVLNQKASSSAQGSSGRPSRNSTLNKNVQGMLKRIPKKSVATHPKRGLALTISPREMDVCMSADFGHRRANVSYRNLAHRSFKMCQENSNLAKALVQAWRQQGGGFVAMGRRGWFRLSHDSLAVKWTAASLLTWVPEWRKHSDSCSHSEEPGDTAAKDTAAAAQTRVSRSGESGDTAAIDDAAAIQTLASRSGESGDNAAMDNAAAVQTLASRSGESGDTVTNDSAAAVQTLSSRSGEPGDTAAKDSAAAIQTLASRPKGQRKASRPGGSTSDSSLPLRFDLQSRPQQQEKTEDGQQQAVKTAKRRGPKKKPPREYGKGSWTDEERILFLVGLRKHGKGKWKEIAKVLTTRSAVQIKSYGQKFYSKLQPGEDIFFELNEYERRTGTSRQPATDSTCVLPGKSGDSLAQRAPSLVQAPSMEDSDGILSTSDSKPRSQPQRQRKRPKRFEESDPSPASMTNNGLLTLNKASCRTKRRRNASSRLGGSKSGLSPQVDPNSWPLTHRQRKRPRRMNKDTPLGSIKASSSTLPPRTRAVNKRRAPPRPQKDVKHADARKLHASLLKGRNSSGGERRNHGKKGVQHPRWTAEDIRLVKQAYLD